MVSGKVFNQYVKDGTTVVKSEIDGLGVWELYTDEQNRPHSLSDGLLYYHRGSGSDPVGTVIVPGLRLLDGVSPVAIEGAGSTLGSLSATASELAPIAIQIQGRLCLDVTTYVAPFKAGYVQ